MTTRRFAMALAIAALCTSRASDAQMIPNIKDPIRKAEKARDATDAATSAQTGQALPQRQAWEAKGARPAAPQSGPTPRAQAGTASGTGSAMSSAGTPAPLPPGFQPVTREVYSYEIDGRRDPFFSLILTEDLRPLISDLKLTAIMYDPSGKHSVGLMRDLVTNAQYRVTTGMTLGRMRVTQIRPRTIMFSVDEFGMNRTDSLFLADTSKTRIR